MRKNIFLVLLILNSFCSLFYAQNVLLIRKEDLRVVPELTNSEKKEYGYHLYIKKKDGIGSIMLTETTKDPSGVSANYAYRAEEYNEINGDEIRILEGRVLDSEYSKFSLVDSTPEKDEIFGKAFHIFIPHRIKYGYPWSRNGTVTVQRGTFINIRAFAKKYTDYGGAFYDNPYMFDLEETAESELKILTDDYNPDADEKFREFSKNLLYSKGPSTIVDDIMKAVNSISPKGKADIVFVMDATGSMKDDVEQLRKEWISRLSSDLKEFESFRLGLLLFRDYGGSYKYKGIPVKFFDFTDDLDVFEKNLNSFVIKGNEGGDTPEAVYEGLYGGLEFYNWEEGSQKKIIMIGDAQPHPVPRGSKKYTKELVLSIASQKKITIDSIITPDEKARRGR